MRCVVLAAGYGSRLRDVSRSKPLTPVAGAPLIAHVLARAAAGGASRFTVVTGHEGGRVEAFLAGHAAATGLAIEAVRVADWSLPNGHSVLAGLGAAGEPCLLTMADHLAAPVIYARAAAALEDAALVLAVDRDLANVDVDMDDVTRVATADGRIVAIGKGLADYDAFDTGVFAVTPALGDAIRAAVTRGAAGSLSEGVAALAGAGRAIVADVTGERWIDVDDPPSLARAEAWLAPTP